jgi:solute carrier family 8 (sodium/calcium exchanger)
MILVLGVKTKLATLSKKRGCEKVGKWLQSISNHLYFCAATSGGDGEMVEQKWLSVLNHITNKHEGHGRKFPKCTHTLIERDWINAGQYLKDALVCISTNFLNDYLSLREAAFIAAFKHSCHY